MNNIIEKLGMNTPDELLIAGDVWKVYELAGLPQPHAANDMFFEQGVRLKKILDDKNEMLEVLIDRTLEIEKHTLKFSKEWHKNITIIEKVCYPLKWSEIKEPSNE